MRFTLANIDPPFGGSVFVFHDEHDGSLHLEGLVPISTTPAELRPFLDAQKPAGIYARMETAQVRLQANVPYPASPAKPICDMLAFVDGLAREDKLLNMETSSTDNAAP